MSTAIAAVVAAGAVAALACTAGAFPTWEQAVLISSGDRALGPELAMNTAGDAVAVWDQEVGADCATSPASLSCIHVVEAASRPRGSGWQMPVDIARPGVGASPQVATNSSGDAAIAWVHDIGVDRVLQASIRRGTSGQWPNPNDLSDSVLQVRNQRIGLDTAGDAVAVWAQRTATSFVVHAEIRPAAAGVWGSALPLSRVEGNATGGPVLDLGSNGNAVVAWIEDGVVRASSGDASTGGWKPAVTLSQSGGSADGDPAIAADPAGDALVVWAWRTSGGDNVVQAAFRPAGGAWDEAVEIGSAATPTDAQVAVDASGNALALWLSGTAGTTLRSAYRTRSGSWSLPVDVAANAKEPRVSMYAAGNAVAVWTSSTSAMIEAALRPADSGEWQAGVDLSGSGGSAPHARAPLAIWNRITPTGVVVEGADLTGGGPLFSHLKIPKRGVVRARASFSVKTAAWSSPVVGAPSWRFGDGGSATGTRVRHAYKKPGRYTVSVTQSDAAGGRSTTSATISIRRRR